MSAHILVIGPETIQNRMLTRYIEEQTGAASECRPAPDQADMVAVAGRRLLLWDCLSNNLAAFWSLCTQRTANGAGPCMALINAPGEWELEMQALRSGADGLFRECEPPEQLIKGIATLLHGDLWYSRKVLARYVREARKVKCRARQADDASTLTAREREVLEHIAAGASNEEIARHLYISASTVKTHAYNIYAKIRVPNRIQAALWAVQNL